MTDNAKQNAAGWLSSIVEMVERLQSGDLDVSEAAREEIEQSVLSVEVRGGWYAPGAPLDANPEEYRVLLTTGGPALQISGDLDGSPSSARLQWQDWFTPWTDYPLSEEEQAAVDTFVSCFWFGE